MFERECTIYAFLLGYRDKLVADIDDARFADQPASGVNHPAWLLGHLTFAADSGLRLLGHERIRADSWDQVFGFGTLPRADRATYPPKDELLQVHGMAHERLSLAARGANADVVAEPNPMAILRRALPTKGDLLAHLLTSHEAMHLGHLSNWRRQMGMPYIF
jgi:hypothetical protein